MPGQNTVNAINPAVDLTVRIYDEFYDFQAEVNANEYDVVNSYFESVFTNKQAAENFTVSLFRVSQQSSVPVLTLLEQIQDQDEIQLTATLCYYLNGLRSSATLLGITSPVLPNYWAARNVLP